MKKLLIILLLSLSLISCSKYYTMVIYDRTYPAADSEIAYADLYQHLKSYNMESIPLDKWIYNDMQHDTIHITQKMAAKEIGKKDNVLFVFTEFKYPKSSYYKFVIRYTGKKY